MMENVEKRIDVLWMSNYFIEGTVLVSAKMPLVPITIVSKVVFNTYSIKCDTNKKPNLQIIFVFFFFTFCLRAK